MIGYFLYEWIVNTYWCKLFYLFLLWLSYLSVIICLILIIFRISEYLEIQIIWLVFYFGKLQFLRVRSLLLLLFIEFLFISNYRITLIFIYRANIISIQNYILVRVFKFANIKLIVWILLHRNIRRRLILGLPLRISTYRLLF